LGFYDFLDRTEIGFLDEKTRKNIDERFKEWGWRWELPKTENGKKIAILICFYSANWISKNLREGKEKLGQVDNRFRYLTTGFLMEKGIPFHEFNLIGFEKEETATKWGLKRHWKKKIDYYNFWYSTCELLYGYSWAWIGTSLYLVASLIGIVGFIQYQFDFTSNDFHKLFFDPFTVYVIFFQFILFYITNFILYIFEVGYDDSIWYISACGLAPGFGIFFKGSKFYKYILYSCLIISIPFFSIPFHKKENSGQTKIIHFPGFRGFFLLFLRLKKFRINGIL
jgi:hypothetical protein